MRWIDFQRIAEEQGLEGGDVIDAIEKNGNCYDICYTDTSGYKGVIEVEE